MMRLIIVSLRIHSVKMFVSLFFLDGFEELNEFRRVAMS
jgi:hypothetical protein